MYNVKVSFYEFVNLKVAVSEIRARYIRDWVSAHNVNLGITEKHWAERIQEINDVDLALSKREVR